MKIMDKELGEYVKAITIPTLILLAWSIVTFVIGFFIPSAGAANASTGAAAASSAVTVGLCLIAYALTLAAGYLAGMNTAREMKGTYMHAAIATLIMAVVYTAFSSVLALINVFRMQAQFAAIGGLGVAIAALAVGIVFGFIVEWVLLAIGAAAGVFMAQKK